MEQIAVIAGTPTDTAFGQALVEQSGRKAYAVAVSNTPQEQTRFQILRADEKEKELLARLKPVKAAGMSRVLVYCNSLSASVDFEALSRKTALAFCTPFDYYRSLAPHFTRLGVLAANAQGASGVERALVGANSALSVLSVGNLRWVEAIEAGRSPASLVADEGLIDVCRFMAQNGCQGIVLGCTHFPVLEEALRAVTSLPLFQPDAFFREWIQSTSVS